MATEIKTWQIVDGKLKVVQSNLAEEGRTEPYDLEEWIASNPTIIGAEVVIIGRQVTTKSGPLDLLGIDSSGNLVIIELKRDKLPREVLAQAIDYASDIASWNIDKISEICTKYTGKSLEDYINESFPKVDLETININGDQRIVLIGFGIESSLERMIEWLSDSYGVNVNAITLNYSKTSSGDEILTRTAIISEEIELERVKRKKKFQIPMSDEPGAYEPDKLKQLLMKYLSQNMISAQRIRDILLPACLKKDVLTRDQLKKEFVSFDEQTDMSKAGYFLSLISSQVGMLKNDFLRQIIKYEYPNYTWEKDNYHIRNEHKSLVKEVLESLKQQDTASAKQSNPTAAVQ